MGSAFPGILSSLARSDLPPLPALDLTEAQSRRRH